MLSNYIDILQMRRLGIPLMESSAYPSLLVVHQELLPGQAAGDP